MSEPSPDAKRAPVLVSVLFGLVLVGFLVAVLVARERQRAAAGAEVLPTNDELEALSRTAAAQEGATLFRATCIACHGPHGEGATGPNLTDRYWLHGGAPRDIYATIAAGSPLKGMPSFRVTLGPERMKQVTAYVLTLRNTDLPGRAPEGLEAK